MADAVIHRCTLRIVRRGGWSWGPDAHSLLERALEALPELLAAQLSDLADTLPGEHVLAEPVRVDVGVSLESLRTQDRIALERALRTALDRAVRPAGVVGGGGERRVGTGGSGIAAAPDERAARTGFSATSPRDLLRRWHEAGDLDAVLSCFSDVALEVWADAVSDGAAAAGLAFPWRDARNAADLGDREHEARSRERRELLQARLATAAAAAAAAAVDAEERLPGDVEVSTSLSTHPTDPRRRATAERTRNASPRAQRADTSSPARRPTFAPRAPSGSHTPRTGSRPLVVRALPFLLVVPLSRLGYLAALGAALDAAGQLARADAFAAGLAYKVLDPPERGWRRSDAARAAAAAFAGGDEPPLDADLTALARHAEAFCSPIDAVLRNPPRGVRRLDEMLAALDERIAVPLAPDDVLERALALAAATALTGLASELSEEGEPADAMHAFERFGDIEARVRFDAGRVRVTLPLGRRHQDLERAGLLGEVRDAPWLGGRVVEFSGG